MIATPGQQKGLRCFDTSYGRYSLFPCCSWPRWHLHTTAGFPAARFATLLASGAAVKVIVLSSPPSRCTSQQTATFCTIPRRCRSARRNPAQMARTGAAKDPTGRDAVSSRPHQSTDRPIDLLASPPLAPARPTADRSVGVHFWRAKSFADIQPVAARAQDGGIERKARCQGSRPTRASMLTDRRLMRSRVRVDASASDDNNKRPRVRADMAEAPPSD
jgi:hypothetical protein